MSVRDSAGDDGDRLTPLERLGGPDAVARLVEAFYRRMDTLPEAATIRRMHAAELGEIRVVLRRYLTEWLGGPPLYSSERGHPRLRMRHLPFAIGAAERDAWLACMRGALAEIGAAPDLAAQLDAAFTRLADHMRNRPD